MKMYLDDVLVVSGCVLIVVAAARVNVTLAIFVAGVFLLLAGIVAAVGSEPRKKL